ncbi:hypothetical protein MJ575_22950 [Klebsiella pneumoniae]|nr:hypothetical protein MJ575_22950 [Klebsiella pneumoniae]
MATRNGLLIAGLYRRRVLRLTTACSKPRAVPRCRAVWFRTGHRDIEKLGGIGKKCR